MRLRIVVAIPLAALAFAGCGGEDKPSKAEFVKSADKVCSDLEKQSDKLAQGGVDNVQEIVQFAKDGKSTAQDAVKRIRALEVPEGADGDKAKEWQAAVTAEAENQLIPALDDLQSAAEANDEKALVEAAQNIENLEATRSDKLANELGMKECGEDSAS